MMEKILCHAFLQPFQHGMPVFGKRDNTILPGGSVMTGDRQGVSFRNLCDWISLETFFQNLADVSGLSHSIEVDRRYIVL